MAVDIEKSRPAPPSGKPLVLVIGGSGRIGGAICRALAREGASVAFTYHRNRGRAEALASEIQGEALAREIQNEALARETGVAFFECDVRDTTSVSALVSRARALGPLHALVVAAGIDASGEAGIGSLDEDEWEELLRVHVGGALRACRAVAPWLVESPGGNIVLLGSLAGVKPLPAPAHYAASKAALKGLVESLAKDLGGSGVCANVISPGVLDHGLVERLCKENRESYLKHSTLGRFGKAEEVAEVAAWFALRNSYITAQAIPLDGGL